MRTLRTAVHLPLSCWSWLLVRSRTNASILAIGSLPAFLAHRGSAQIVINEAMADNRSEVAHQDSFPDYIELHNTGNEPVSLEGWSLSDDPSVPRRFVFPAGTVVAPRGYLLVWADTRVDLPGLHTGFGLGLEGDVVRLYPSTSVVVIDQIAFGLQPVDFLTGRVPDGPGIWDLTVPSAGSVNVPAARGDPARLRFNEWMARPMVGEDWIELYNPESAPVALAGVVVTDRLSASPPNRAIPPFSFIAPQGWVRLFASDLLEPGAHHLDFKLSAAGETLTLLAAAQSTELRARADYNRAVSQLRFADGSLLERLHFDIQFD